jgi:SAM-dependent methyltransferase
MEQVPWKEDSYGILKRWVVFREWVETYAERRGLSRLRVLDYGCGTGALVTYPLALLGHTVLGSDVHDPSIELARTRYQLPNLTFEALSIEKLLEQAAQFDVVICSEVLEHLVNPGDFLRSLRRLVVPHGIVIITTPNGYGSYELCCSLERGFKRCGIDQWMRKIHQLFRPSSGQYLDRQDDAERGQQRNTIGFLNVDSGHIQFFRRRTLEQLFRGAGFVIVERRARTLLCGPYLDQLLKRLPFRGLLYQFNGRLADSLPFAWAADWMYLLQPDVAKVT